MFRLRYASPKKMLETQCGTSSKARLPSQLFRTLAASRFAAGVLLKESDYYLPAAAVRSQTRNPK
jgi:hypothetical protein